MRRQELNFFDVLARKFIFQHIYVILRVVGCVYVCVCVCGVCVRACVCVCDFSTYSRESLFFNTCMRSCVCVCVRVCVYMCLCVCVYVCVHECVCVCVCKPFTCEELMLNATRLFLME